MATTLVPLIVGLLGGLGSAVVTQLLTNRREDARWRREREHEQARWAREDAARSHERMQYRLADSYLEVLRIVEREGRWIEARITNLKITAEAADLELQGWPRDGLSRRKLVKMPPEPAVTDQATIAAHLAAFGSDNVRRLCQAWRSAIAAIQFDLAVLETIADDYQEGQEHPLHYVKDLWEKLHPNEVRTRQALADAIAKELGHRERGAGDH